MLIDKLRKECRGTGLCAEGVHQVASIAMYHGRLPDPMPIIRPPDHLIPRYVQFLKERGYLNQDGSVNEDRYRQESI